MILIWFLFICIFALNVNTTPFEYSQTEDQLIYTSRELRQLFKPPINISNCLMKSSSVITLFQCQEYSFLMNNEEIIKPSYEIELYFIDDEIIFSEVSFDYALFISNGNHFYLFSQKKYKLAYFSFSAQHLYKKTIESVSFMKYFNFVVIAVRYREEIEEDQTLHLIILDPKNYELYRQSKILLKDQNKTPSNSKIQLRLNKITGNIEIVTISIRNTVLVYYSEKFELNLKFRKEFFFENNTNLEEIIFSHNSDMIAFLNVKNGYREILVYRNDNFHDKISLVCEIFLESLQVSNEEPVVFGFFEEEIENDIFYSKDYNYQNIFKYLLISFYDRNMIYFYKIEDYFNSYGKTICTLLKRKFNVNSLKNLTVNQLGKHFSFINLKESRISSEMYTDTTFKFILLGHNDYDNFEFAIFPFCNDKERMYSFECHGCLSDEFSEGFQSSDCISCNKEPGKNVNFNLSSDLVEFRTKWCNLNISTNNSLIKNNTNLISCAEIMTNFDIVKPINSSWALDPKKTLGTPFPCKATCDNNEDMFHDTCINSISYLGLYNKCSNIRDCFNCTSTPYCSWESQYESCYENSDIPSTLSTFKENKCPVKSACKMQGHFTRAGMALKFYSSKEEMKQNEWCLINIRIISYDEYYTQINVFIIDLIKEFLEYKDKEYFILELCIYLTKNSSCELMRVNFAFDRDQSLVFTEKVSHFDLKMTFLKSMKIDFSKFNIEYEYKLHSNISETTNFIKMIIILIFVGIFILFIVIKTIILCVQERNNSLEKKLQRLLKNKFIKKVIFIQEDNIEFEQKECSFCLEFFLKNDKLTQISCKHVFHEKCFNIWVKHQNDNLKCPICRGDLQSVEHETLLSPQVNMEMSSIN